MARRSAAKIKPSPAAKPGAPTRIDPGWLGGTVGFHLRTAQEAAFQAFSKRANGADARPWRFAVLALIDANPGLTQGELAAAIRRNTSSLTPVLDDLCRQGYVSRERLESDRRTYALHLTPKGNAARIKLMASAIEHEREFDRLLGSKRAEFVRILKSLAAALALASEASGQREQPKAAALASHQRDDARLRRAMASGQREQPKVAAPAPRVASLRSAARLAQDESKKVKRQNVSTKREGDE
jgi:DNA-binding MarR family transcriptional regulator